MIWSFTSVIPVCLRDACLETPQQRLLHLYACAGPLPRLHVSTSKSNVQVMLERSTVHLARPVLGPRYLLNAFFGFSMILLGRPVLWQLSMKKLRYLALWFQSLLCIVWFYACYAVASATLLFSIRPASIRTRILGVFERGYLRKSATFVAVAVWVPRALLGLPLMFFLFLGMTLRLFRVPKSSPIHTAQPHCIATIPQSCLTVVIHCMSWWHCISNWLCPCANPSIGLTLEQQPHLSPGALPLCTASSTAQCDHAHAVHTALREFAEIVRKLCGKLPDILLLRQRRVRKVAEIGGNWRKLAESGGKWRKVAESGGNSRKVAEIGGKRSHNNLFFGIHMAVCTDTPCFCTSGVFHFCRRLCCTWARQACK